MPDPYYEDESVTLYHGDCLELASVFAWTCADVLVTDPPYGISQGVGGPRRNPAGIVTHTARRPISGDDSLSVRDAALTLWGNRPALVFGSWKMPHPENTRTRLIWHKVNTTPALGDPWTVADEEIYVLGSGFVGPRRLNVYETHEARAGSGGLAAQVGHPTPKPVSLMRDLIAYCPPGVIADPFAGSGTTLRAAKDLGRKAIGVEIEEKYCEIIARRLAQEVLPL